MPRVDAGKSIRAKPIVPIRPASIAPRVSEQRATYVGLDAANAASRYVRTNLCHPIQPAYCTRARCSRSRCRACARGEKRGTWRFTTPLPASAGPREHVPEVVSPGAHAYRTSDPSVVARCLVTLLAEGRRAFRLTKIAGAALSVKKNDREDDPRCLPSAGARALELRYDPFPRRNVAGVVRPSIACRGERRARTLRCVSGVSPSAEPPPT